MPFNALTNNQYCFRNLLSKLCLLIYVPVEVEYIAHVDLDISALSLCNIKHTVVRI